MAAPAKKVEKVEKVKEPMWRVSVDVLPPAEDVILHVDSETAANELVTTACKNGYVVRDRKQDATRYETEIIPIHRVLRFVIYERE